MNGRFVPIFGLWLTLVVGTIRSEDDPPLLLVLSFDGLRGDFLNERRMPSLTNWAKRGVWAPRGIIPQVVTVTAPSYFTIATGLYQETHGIVGNTFYDPEFRQVYDYWQEKNDDELGKLAREAKWYTGEPIWQTNDKASEKHRSGGMRWPLCDAEVNNRSMAKCWYWVDYGTNGVWQSELDTLLSWYVDKKEPINLGFFYVSEPDHTNHNNDIMNSPNVNRKLAELDSLIPFLRTRLRQHNLTDRMNVLFVADHGHANVQTSNVINLSDILHPDDYIISSKSFFPNPQKPITAEDIYQALLNAKNVKPNFELWRKEDVPEHFHYRNNRRIGPVVYMEMLGSNLIKKLEDFPTHSIFGDHGFSKEYPEMRPAFFAVGPAFKKNLTINWDIENIDLYNLMAAVLKVKPAPNNGSFARVQTLLEDTYLNEYLSEIYPNKTDQNATDKNETDRKEIHPKEICKSCCTNSASNCLSIGALVLMFSALLACLYR